MVREEISRTALILAVCVPLGVLQLHFKIFNITNAVTIFLNKIKKTVLYFKIFHKINKCNINICVLL